MCVVSYSDMYLFLHRDELRLEDRNGEGTLHDIIEYPSLHRDELRPLQIVYYISSQSIYGLRRMDTIYIFSITV